VKPSFKRLHNSIKQFFANICQWDACGQGFSVTIVPI